MLKPQPQNVVPDSKEEKVAPDTSANSVQEQTRHRTAVRIAGIEGIEGFSDVVDPVQPPAQPPK